jgi:hypothetical protein
MTPDDELERELESLRPSPPSPELRRRIGRRVVRQGRRRLWIGIALAAAAAAVLIGLSVRPQPAPPGQLPPSLPEAAAVPPPSVLAYQHAFAESSAALDALLDEQAVRSSRDVTPARAAIIPNLMVLKGSRE